MNKFIFHAFILALSSHASAGISENEFEQKYCDGDCEQQLVAQHDLADPLSTAEHYLIQQYTETYTILDKDMFIQAISKIPTTTLISYRGTTKVRTKIQTLGQVIQLNSITSVSAERFIAENFIQDQLLIIKAKSAHSISRYSVMGEKELILLPGTQLRVDKIYTEKVDISSEGLSQIINVEIVELTEV